MNRFGLLVTGLILSWATHSLLACCPVAPSGSAVVNADQTVLMIWNAKSQTQHFIRQASLKSDSNDVGFIVPSPTQPTLAESDNLVFANLREITKPEIIYRDVSQGMSCGCGSKDVKSARAPEASKSAVEVVEQRRVAGYDATVLRADTGEALTAWLRENQYEYSEAVSAWAKPYIEKKWFFTALKIAPKQANASTGTNFLESPALRISFTTERPLFPYREPKSDAQTAKLEKPHRDLAIFFIADQRYQGQLGPQETWTGETVWANELKSGQIESLLMQLKLPANSMPDKPWLTEFADRWPYDKAQSDLLFDVAKTQTAIARPQQIIYREASAMPRDVTVYALAALIFWPVHRRKRER
jgi:hypothetical protein